MLRWVCVCLLCLCGCGPFALGSGAASILAPKGGSGDQTPLHDDALFARSRALAHDGAGDRAVLAIASEMGDPSSLRSIHLTQKKLRHAAADGPFALPMELEGDLEEATQSAFEGPGVEPAVPGEPSFAAAQMRIADVNSDGVPDLVLLSRSRPALAVLLSETDDAGHATGTFAAPVVTLLPVATSARSMVVGDFNSDGIPDAAVATRFAATHRIQIFLGGGTLEGR